MRVSELLSSLHAPVYIERCTLEDSKNIMKTRKAIRRALQNQIDNRGFSLVEVLSPCPTGWKMEPTDSREWVATKMVEVFPPGVYKDRKEAEARPITPHPVLSSQEILDAIGVSDQPDEATVPVSPEFKTHSLVLAGFGGQGVLLLGQLIAKAAMREGKFVSWLPSYGPEMRGGTANCHVTVSPSRIGSPFVTTPTHVIAMNQPSMEKFAPLLKEGGYMIYDSSFVKDVPLPAHVKPIAIPFSEIANTLGNAKVANMVAAGALIALTGITDEASMIKLIHTLPRKALIEVNLKALAAGRERIEALVSENAGAPV